MLTFTRKFPTGLRCSCTILQPAPHQQQCRRDLVGLHHCQHIVLSVFSALAILMGIKWYLIVVFIFISLKTNATEYLLLHVFLIYIYILCCNAFCTKALVCLVAHICIVNLNFLCNLDTNSLWYMYHKYIFLAHGFSVHFLNGDFWDSGILNRSKVLIFFLLWFSGLVSYPENLCLCHGLKGIFTCYLLELHNLHRTFLDDRIFFHSCNIQYSKL